MTTSAHMPPQNIRARWRGRRRGRGLLPQICLAFLGVFALLGTIWGGGGLLSLSEDSRREGGFDLVPEPAVLPSTEGMSWAKAWEEHPEDMLQAYRLRHVVAPPDWLERVQALEDRLDALERAVEALRWVDEPLAVIEIEPPGLIRQAQNP